MTLKDWKDWKVAGILGSTLDLKHSPLKSYLGVVRSAPNNQALALYARAYKSLIEIMSEHLLAILLATTSAKGSSLVCQWPAHPSTSPRLRRAPPKSPNAPSQLDNPWKASHPFYEPPPEHVEELDDDYFWESTQMKAKRDRSASASKPTSSSGRSTPAADEPEFSANRSNALSSSPEYNQVFGYSSEFLAGLLCPIRSMCHQKFELFVDEIAFTGHPVCSDDEEVWRFRNEPRSKHGGRGRQSRSRAGLRTPQSATPSHGNELDEEEEDDGKQRRSWLQSFHVVFVLDLPDTSSAESGNVSKFMDVIYEELAFTVTAVLYREQILSNYVETECDKLFALREECVSQGLPFSEFIAQSLIESSIASAMKTIFESVKSSSIAYLTLHDLPLELQLPPYLDGLLQNQSELGDAAQIDEIQYEEGGFANYNWGSDMQIGWRLPSLTPWKGLLLLDNDPHWNPIRQFEKAHLAPGERDTAEGLIRFLELASVTLSLGDMATLLDWDLHAQVLPVTRWLVKHRRAKVVDVVHPGLRTAYTIPTKFDQTIADLTRTFKEDIIDQNPQIPPLPVILSIISISSSTKENTFFTALVKDKAGIPLWHEVLLWMLKRDLLVTLHLRIRLVATAELKSRVSAKKPLFVHRGRRKSIDQSPNPDDVAWLSMSPRTAHNFSHRFSSKDSGKSQLSELDMGSSNESEGAIPDEDEDEEESSGVDRAVDTSGPTIIVEPGKANRIERRWLAAMSQGKDPWIARRFQQIYQYFDGRKTDSEILYLADITRKELREVLHRYEEYVLSFLHPS